MVGFEVDFLPFSPVFVEGSSSSQLLLAQGERWLPIIAFVATMIRYLLLTGFFARFCFRLCVLRRLNVVGDGLGCQVNFAHLVLQVEQVDHVEASAHLPGG